MWIDFMQNRSDNNHRPVWCNQAIYMASRVLPRYAISEIIFENNIDNKQ